MATKQEQANPDRLFDLASEFSQLSERDRQIVLRMAGDNTGTASTPRRGRKKSSGRRQSQSRSQGSNSGRRALSEEGLSVKAHLVRDIMPHKSSKEGMDVNGMVEALREQGIEPQSADPRTTIRQAVQSLKGDGYVEVVDRGNYRLTKPGEKWAGELSQSQGESE